MCIENLLSKKYNYVTKSAVGHSVFDRPIDILTISDPANLATDDNTEEGVKIKDSKSGKKIKVVFIMGRVHPGETPSSFVIQGLIDFLVSQHEIAACLREHIMFKIIPMLNPDGVFLGNQRCNVLGQDLNRSWATTCRYLSPELMEVKKMLLHYDNHVKFDLDMVKISLI